MQTTYPYDAAFELLPPDPLEGGPMLADAPQTGRWHPPSYRGTPRRVQLAPRLADVLVGVIRGEKNKQIAKRLHLSEDTVKTHLRRLFAKLEAHDRAHAAALFLTGEVELFIDHYPNAPRPAPPVPMTRRAPSGELPAEDAADPL